MKRRLSILVICLIVGLTIPLIGCTTTPESKLPLPPDGYSSWYEYHEEYKRQTESTQVTSESTPETGTVSELIPIQEEGQDKLGKDEQVAEKEEEEKLDYSSEIELDYSWSVKSNYTFASAYISNLSDDSVDITLRIKAFNSGGVTIYDEQYILSDIWAGDVYYKLFNVTGTDTTSLEVEITDTYPTHTSPSSNRTDLVILHEMPIIPEEQGGFNIDIRNDSDNQLCARVKVRLYDLEGYLKYTGTPTFRNCLIEPHETKRLGTGALSMSPSREYYVYLID